MELGIYTFAETTLVGSWAEYEDAMGAAWSEPGVARVRDDITVAY